VSAGSFVYCGQRQVSGPLAPGSGAYDDALWVAGTTGATPVVVAASGPAATHVALAAAAGRLDALDAIAGTVTQFATDGTADKTVVAGLSTTTPAAALAVAPTSGDFYILDAAGALRWFKANSSLGTTGTVINTGRRQGSRRGARRLCTSRSAPRSTAALLNGATWTLVAKASPLGSASARPSRPRGRQASSTAR
jgi:hypothetical protein